MNPPPQTSPKRLQVSFRRAFTLVEILVSLGVLAILLLISAEVIGSVQTTWTASNARISQFREARTAFDIISRNISQATLNTYLDYDVNYLVNAEPSAATTAAPTEYLRKSDLRFVCGNAPLLVLSGGGEENLPGHAVFFQAPLGVTHDPQFAGLDRLLCGRGYFVQFSSDEFFRPEFINAGNLKYRYRLMEYSPPAETNLIYSDPATKSAWLQAAGRSLRDSSGQSGTGGSESAVNRGMTRPISDNIIALIVSPMLDTSATAAAGGGSALVPTSIAPTFAFDSEGITEGVKLANVAGMGPQGTKYLLPPLVRIVLIAIDERSAERLAQTSGGSDGQNAPFGARINEIIGVDAAGLSLSLEEVARVLREEYKVNYRIFSATVALRGAKWST